MSMSKKIKTKRKDEISIDVLEKIVFICSKNYLVQFLKILISIYNQKKFL
jgi:hypothetical protein